MDFPTLYAANVLEGGGGSGDVVMKQGYIRPDAEHLKNWSYDKQLVRDLAVTLPSYSSSRQTLIASAGTLEPSFPIEDDYLYLFIGRALIYPIYDTTDVSNGRFGSLIRTLVTEYYNFPAQTVKLIGTSDTVESKYATYTAFDDVKNIGYYSNKSSFISSNAPFTFSISPTYSSGTFSISQGGIQVIGNTYLTSAWWSHMTDVRFQYQYDLYRVPKTASGYGWTRASSLTSIMDANNSADGKLLSLS